VEAFSPLEIVGGPDAGSSAGTGSGATIAESDDDDPQLAAAVKLARQALRGGNK
jgi:hypothetical protein